MAELLASRVLLFLCMQYAVQQPAIKQLASCFLLVACCFTKYESQNHTTRPSSAAFNILAQHFFACCVFAAFRTILPPGSCVSQHKRSINAAKRTIKSFDLCLSRNKRLIEAFDVAFRSILCCIYAAFCRIDIILCCVYAAFMLRFAAFLLRFCCETQLF